MQREGNLIRVAPQSVLEKELEQEVARAKAAVELKPLETAPHPAQLRRRHADAAARAGAAVAARQGLGRRAHQHAHHHRRRRRTSRSPRTWSRNLDTQTPQVSIEARIVEATHQLHCATSASSGAATRINSAATGNATGLVFPSTVGVAGGATDATTNVNGLQLGQSGAASPNFAVNLPAAVGTGSGGALGLTLGSLSGTRQHQPAPVGAGGHRQRAHRLGAEDHDARQHRGVDRAGHVDPDLGRVGGRHQHRVRPRQAQPHGQAARDQRRLDRDDRAHHAQRARLRQRRRPRRSDDPQEARPRPRCSCATARPR